MNKYVSYTPTLSLKTLSLTGISDSLTGEEIFAALLDENSSNMTILDTFAAKTAEKPPLAALGNIGTFSADRNLIDSGSRITSFVSADPEHVLNVPNNQAVVNYVKSKATKTILSELEPETISDGDVWLKIL